MVALLVTIGLILRQVESSYYDPDADYFIRRCSATVLVGRDMEVEISRYDISFDFDDPNICINVNNIPTSAVPIKNNTNQGDPDTNPEDNVYNTIQANLNCFGGYRAIIPACSNDYTVWFPMEGSDNTNMITNERTETSAFPERPCYIKNGCPDTPTLGGPFDYDFHSRGDYICANLDTDGFFEYEDIFLITCSVFLLDGPLPDNIARVEVINSDTFPGASTTTWTNKYGTFRDQDCSFGLPSFQGFDVHKECIAGIVEHHGTMRSDDQVLTITSNDDIYVEWRTILDVFIAPPFRNRVKVKFLCGDFDAIGYRAFRCNFQGNPDSLSADSSFRFHEFTKRDCWRILSEEQSQKRPTKKPYLGKFGNECLGYLRRYRQCGVSYNYQVLNEGDYLTTDDGTINGPAVVWELDTNTCNDRCNNNDCNNDSTDIEVDFLCPKRGYYRKNYYD